MADSTSGERQPPALEDASGSAPMESRLARIARRAHQIYEARRGEHGKAMEDWLQAEREVDAEI